MPIISVPKVLREKLGDEGVDSLIELINKADDKAKEDILVFVEEKFERRLSEEISKVNQRLTEEIAKIEVKIAAVKADLIKWMFVFWVGQIGVLVGILFAFFK